MLHFGDPCIYCGVGHDDAAPGPCPGERGRLTRLVAELHEARAALKAHDEASKLEAARLNGNFVSLQTSLNHYEAGLDADRIALAETILAVRGKYANGGTDRASVISDAVQWLATGNSKAYRGLDAESYGTKSYDAWHGQRCDCEPGMGPRHGSIIFQVGLKDRKRALTADETEAAIYYLLNLERIQTAADQAREAA